MKKIQLFLILILITFPLSRAQSDPLSRSQKFYNLPDDWSNEGMLAKGWCMKIANQITPYQEIMDDIQEGLDSDDEFLREWHQGAVDKMNEWGCFDW